MIEARPDATSFAKVARALDDEADGRELRAELADNFHDALEPAVGAVRAAIAGAGGLPHAGEPLRTAIAAAVSIDVRLGGRSAGARIRVSKRGMPRNFINAPKRFNQHRFTRRVYGRDVVVTQVGAPGWFDTTLDHGGARYRLAAARALDNVADRIDRKT